MQLTEKNFNLFAARHYDNPHCVDEEEFYEDLNHLKYLKRLLRRYLKSEKVDHKLVRLTLNHIIVITNVFGVEPGVEIIFFKMEPELYPILKPYLEYLGMLPKTVQSINTCDIKDIEEIRTFLKKV